MNLQAAYETAISLAQQSVSDMSTAEAVNFLLDSKWAMFLIGAVYQVASAIFGFSTSSLGFSAFFGSYYYYLVEFPLISSYYTFPSAIGDLILSILVNNYDASTFSPTNPFSIVIFLLIPFLTSASAFSGVSTYIGWTSFFGNILSANYLLDATVAVGAMIAFSLNIAFTVLPAYFAFSNYF